MITNKYPRVGSWRPPKNQGRAVNTGRMCVVCGAAPAGLQFIEISIFRGDDEHIAACKTCSRQRKPEVLDAYKRTSLNKV